MPDEAISMTNKASSWFYRLAFVLLVYSSGAYPESRTNAIQPNDNQTPAGQMKGSVLNVRLVAENGTWYPEGEQNPGLEIQAFREEGGPLQVPAPLLRMPSGTEVAVSVRNAISGTSLEVHGLQARPGDTEEVLTVPSGETRTARFAAGAPGTYFYWATTGDQELRLRTGVDSQLSGAFVVDPWGADETDRIFVLGEWLDPEAPSFAATERAAFVINGLAWPYTERIHLRVGERARWRFVNPSSGGHPLHLHGAFYKVRATGSLLESTPYPAGQERSVVTELLRSGTTMRTEWTPEHEGNWLFHCHIVAHVSPLTRLGKPYKGNAATAHNHALEGMGGMVMGIEVAAAEGDSDVADRSRGARNLTMFLERKEGHYGKNPGFGVSFQEAGAPRPPAVVPGPPLFLTRGQQANIKLVNNLGEPTSVHWHGMELESYYDGVAGFSGTVTSITPPVMPGESFDVRFTPPRAGTFIYHTHMDDDRQLSAGLYGAMIISDPDEPFDPEVEKIFVIGLLGFTEPETIGINGDRHYRIQLNRGVEYRLRIINITSNNAGFNVTLTSRSRAVEWRPVAKDGAELPSGERTPCRADRHSVSVGETFDFAWTPTTSGPHWLEVRRGNGEWMAQARLDVN